MRRMEHVAPRGGKINAYNILIRKSEPNWKELRQK
jgi:hypothetical protein